MDTLVIVLLVVMFGLLIVDVAGFAYYAVQSIIT
jgi:hypothetical protein